MERFLYRTGIVLTVILIAVQGYIFYDGYEKTEYSDRGKVMTEETYLFAHDELTISVAGDLKNAVLYKNGEAVARNFGEAYTISVRENDLLQLKADEEEEIGAIVTLSLLNGVFDEKYYVKDFDFFGGFVTIGRFVLKNM